MINNTSQVAATYASAQTNVQSKSTGATASTADILSSFKEILSLMTATNGASTAGQQAGMGLSDLMAPLMLIMLERLIEQQVDKGTSTSSTGTTLEGVSTNQAPKSEPSGRPVAGGILTQDFHPGHTGIDIAVPTGTPVKTTMDGKVIQAGWNEQGYGNLVIVENGAYRTYYAHLSSIPVSVGDSVTAGSTIGLSGSTGHSTGPHLHYEIRKNKVPIDPAPVTLTAGA